MSVTDLFRVVVPSNRINKNFAYIASSTAHSCSRRMLQKAYDLLPKPDGNFVEDFQSTGFDARIWELYLVQFLNDAGLKIAQPFDRPDCLVSRGTDEVWIEATTANPTQGVGLQPPSNHWEGQDETAIKLGSALWSKLNKRYWELAHVANKPLVLAIEDFHDPDPLRSSSHALGRYLFGVHTQLTSKSGERVQFDLHEISDHELGKKIVPSGFFNLPDSEHISAVLFSNAGTVAKFNRMGYQETPDPTVRMIRFGMAYDPHPSSLMGMPFSYLVGDMPEGWGDELMLFHNPHALHPLPDDFFGPLAEEKYVGDQLSSSVTGFHPYYSLTQTLADITPDLAEMAEKQLIEMGEKWVETFFEHEQVLEQMVIDTHEQWKSKP